MNHLAKYLTMKIIPREYENDLDQIIATKRVERLHNNPSIP